MEEAILENLEVLKISPKDYASHKNLAILYQQADRLADALNSAKTALTVAPDSEKAALQAFITQVEAALNQSGS
jgi:Tfp pilus assembly protein PilF